MQAIEALDRAPRPRPATWSWRRRPAGTLGAHGQELGGALPIGRAYEQRQTLVRPTIYASRMPRTAGQAQGSAPPSAVVVLVRGRDSVKPGAQRAATRQQRQIPYQGQFITSDGSAGAAAPAAGQLPSPLLPRPSRRLLRGLLLAAAVAAVAAGITLLVLWKAGVLSGGSEDEWQPLAYAQRSSAAAAQPAFAAELHPWLLPAEQAALGQQLDADVIIVGAGVAGLKAAEVLATRMRVLVLEARVSTGGHVGLRAAACSSNSTVYNSCAHLPNSCFHPHQYSSQSRVGGRIRSVPFAGGTAELGAQFIWGAESDIDGGSARQGNPVTEVRAGWAVTAHAEPLD